jgi:hypothetical protein
MSVVIEFTQIEKQNIISENKIFGLYEVPLDEIKWKKGCYLKTDIFQELKDDANKWGEVYFQPNIAKFLFYLLAIDTEMSIGIRTVEDKDIITAHEPKTINEFLVTAKEYTTYGKEGIFNELSELVEDAINNELLIVSRIS